MKTPSLRRPFAAPILSLSLLVGPVAAQDRDDPEPVTPQNAPSSPLDPTGRPIDRGSGNNPNRINSSSQAVNADNSRPVTDRMGGVARGFSPSQMLDTLSGLQGRDVQASAGGELGELSDLVVDATSGEIAYAVISAGGVLGLGGTERVIAFQQLQPRAGETLNAALSAEAFAQQPEINGTELSGGTEAADARGGDKTKLVRASELVGREIRGMEGNIGTVEDLVVNPNRRSVSLVVEVVDELAKNDADRFVIGFNQLSPVTTNDSPLRSRLERKDFQGTARLNSNADVSSGRPYVWRGGRDRSTGADAQSTTASRSDVASNSGAAGMGWVEAARQRSRAEGGNDAEDGTLIQAVQKALQADPEVGDLASAVSVEADGEGVLLTGEVRDAASRERIVEAARASAQGRPVEDRITVRAAAE